MKNIVTILLVFASTFTVFGQTPDQSIEYYDFLNVRIGKKHKISVVSAVETQEKVLLESISYVEVERVKLPNGQKNAEGLDYVVKQRVVTKQTSKTKFKGTVDHYRIPKTITLVSERTGDKYEIPFTSTKYMTIDLNYHLKKHTIEHLFYNMPAELFLEKYYLIK
jgi:hypothetical protein